MVAVLVRRPEAWGTRFHRVRSGCVRPRVRVPLDAARTVLRSRLAMRLVARTVVREPVGGGLLRLLRGPMRASSHFGVGSVGELSSGWVALRSCPFEGELRLRESRWGMFILLRKNAEELSRKRL